MVPLHPVDLSPFLQRYATKIYGEYQDDQIRNSALHNERWTSDIDGHPTDRGIDNSNFLIDSDQLHFFLQMMILGQKR